MNVAAVAHRVTGLADPGVWLCEGALGLCVDAGATARHLQRLRDCFTSDDDLVLATATDDLRVEQRPELGGSRLPLPRGEALTARQWSIVGELFCLLCMGQESKAMR